MGQILGTGYAAGDRSKSKTSVNIPPELRQLYRQQVSLTQGLMPQYSDLIGRVMGGDTSAIAPYTASLEGAYTPMSGSFIPGVAAYTAPYAAAIQNAQQQIRRAMPTGGAQQLALAQATMQGGMQMGAARAQQAQRDIDARNALMQRDLEQLGALRTGDIQQRNQMMQKVLALYSGLFGGFNPQTQAGSTQTSSTPGRLGFPGWEMMVGG